MFCGWPAEINIVNRLCVCPNAAYVDFWPSLFERQLVFLNSTFVVTLSNSVV